MELFLDIDGVILDFEAGFMDFIRDEYIHDLPPGYVPKSWTMDDEFGALDIQEVWDRFLATKRFTQLNLLIDAQSFNQVAARFPIHLITNLPKSQYLQRQQNLEFHSLKYTSLHLAGHFNYGDENYPSKSDAVAKLRTPGKRLIFLDDHPRNCQNIKNAFPESEVFLMSRPHNSKAEVEDWIRVDSWDEFLLQLD
ncbi:MAG: hypothetical protein COB67_05790 [SAR324 cluster bacterium]|uniref:Haloacid dehalogenase n=1 Tax=SAR324 cluster bacterium TaxID=2024889 RepID=A0A2A4T6Q7_9DELT|nr:MAG: hypothetical protein COB67_05790 [SAR324 cluster bacterium]